jgi:2-polyprenyl-6-methoxyphenol hydroxylase-like FAD-dependent oxidoreductase
MRVGRVVVSGKGVGALAAALALSKQGVGVRVLGDPYARRAVPGNLSAGAVLCGSAMAALSQMGVTDALYACGLPTLALHVCNASGSRLAALSLAAPGLRSADHAELFCVSRRDLVDCILAALPSGVLATDGASVTGFLNRDCMAVFGDREAPDPDQIGGAPRAGPSFISPLSPHNAAKHTTSVIRSTHPGMMPPALAEHVLDRDAVGVRVTDSFGVSRWHPVDVLVAADGVRSRVCLLTRASANAAHNPSADSSPCLA